jgi:hypothetical protein
MKLWNLLLCILGAGMLAVEPAAAKTIPLDTLSRNRVESACSRAGGSTFGFRDDTAAYGCETRRGSVVCQPDGQCLGYVSDLVRMPASSIDAILGGRMNGQPIRIGRADPRIAPRVN